MKHGQEVTLDLTKFREMFAPGDVIHWKEGIWNGQPNARENHCLGEQEVTGRIISFAGKSASIEILTAKITDSRVHPNSHIKLSPHAPGKVMRKMITTLLKGNVAKTVAPDKKELPALKTVTNYDAPKVGRNDPCPCGSEKKFKKCCGANQEKKGDETVASAIPYTDPAIPSPAQMAIDTEQCKAELIELWKVFYADRNPGGKKKYKGLGLWPMDLYNAVNEFADEVRPFVREKYRYMVWNAMHGTDERMFWLILNIALHESKTCKPADVRDVFTLIREEKGIVDKKGKMIKKV